MTMHDRNMQMQMPDSIPLEQSLLGAILVNNASYWQVAGFLKPGHFSEPIHQEIYDTMGKLIAENRPATPINMAPYLPTARVADNLTVPQYVVRLATEAIRYDGIHDVAGVFWNYGRAARSWRSWEM